MHMQPDIEARLKDVMRAFLTENAKVNLSALRTEEACWTGNILDSLALLDIVQTIPSSSIIDVGTGGGFPLLPLAVALPRSKCVGLDAIRKKMDAIGRIVSALGLKNVELVTERAENVAREARHRDAYDIVTARAVAPVNMLLEYCAPFAKTGGHVVLWKSMHASNELAESAAAQKALNCSFVAVHTYDLGGDWGERQLLLFQKTHATPKQYPRPVGVPKKSPIQ